MGRGILPERIISWLGHLPGAIVMEWLPIFCWPFPVSPSGGNTAKNGSWQNSAGGWLFLLPACLIHGAYLLTAWPPPRAFAGSFALLLVCACIVLLKPEKCPAWGIVFSDFSNPACAFCSLSCCGRAASSNSLNQLVEKDGKYCARQKRGHNSAHAPGQRRQVLGAGKIRLYDLSGDPHFWINRAIAAHYGLDEVRAEGGRTSAWQAPAKGAVIPMELKCADNVLEAEIRPEDSAKLPDRLHIYYYGEPALLLRPAIFGRGKFGRLARGWRFRASRRWLLPILLAGPISH